MQLLVFALAVSAVYAESFYGDLTYKPSQQNRRLYDSKLLHYVQMAKIFPDSKTFVDLRMKYPEKTILSAFNELLLKTQNKPTNEKLSEFINLYFDSESGLDVWTPSDFKAEPDFLATIKDPQLRQFAKNVNNMWPALGRKMKPVVYENPESFSMMPVQNGFIIPGGKYKELYYGDSYWIIEGLLTSGMKDTAKGMISNFVELQRQYGYIPSGDRYYYLGQSQPPVLAAMMGTYYRKTNDVEFLRENFDALVSELEYWLDTHSVVFNVAGREHSLLRYISPSASPRPESYYEDYTNAQAFESEQRQKQFYTDINSAAESGWTYSSRWLINKNGSNTGDLTSMSTTDIIPVDLNALFVSTLQDVAHFCSVLNDSRKGVQWEQIRTRWVNSMKEVLWNDEDGIWYDWDLTNSRPRKYFYTSNLAPLWTGIVEPEFLRVNSQKILNYIRKTNILAYPGGVPASLTNSGLPWDLPYAWPSQVSIIVNALEALETEESAKMAFEVAQNLVQSIYKGYLTNKRFYEKYNAESPGKVGNSGDYIGDEGFGWTIGVIVEMLAKYGATMSSVKGYVPFPTKFPQYSQSGYVTKPQQSVFNQHYSSSFPVKPLGPVTKPEVITNAPAKPVYFASAPAKPSIAPTYFTQSTYFPSYPSKPVYKPSAKPEYVTSAPIKTEHITLTETKPEYAPSVEVVAESTSPVYHKPDYVSSAQVKPQYTSSFQGKPEITTVQPTQFVSSTYKPESITSYPETPLYDSSVEAKPQYISSTTHEYLAPAPLKPEIDSATYTKPSYVASTPVKPEYIPSIEAKPELVSVAYPAKPLHVSSFEIKPQYISSAKPSYVASAPFTSEHILSTEAKPALVSEVYTKPSYVAPAIKNPEYIPSAEAKPELVSSDDAKPIYISYDEVKPEFGLSTPSKPEYIPTTSAKPEFVFSYTVKPSYASLLETKPQYISAVKPSYVASAPVTSEHIVSTEAKPALVSEVYTKPSYVASALVKPEYIPSAEAKPELVSAEYANPSYIAHDEVKPEFDLSTPSKPEYVPTTSAKPEYVSSYPAKPFYISSLETKPQYISSAKPSYVAFASVKPEYTHLIKPKPEAQPKPGFASAAYNIKPIYAEIKPPYTVQAKPEYISTTEPKSEFVSSTTPVPEYVPTTPSKPEYVTLYPAKPTYISNVDYKPQYISSAKPDYAVPIKPEVKPQYWQVQVKPQQAQVNFFPSAEPKPEYVQTTNAEPAILPTKEVYIQSAPTKETLTSQSLYLPSSAAKPFFVPTKPALVPAVPLYVASETTYTTPYPVSTEYESSSVTEPEYTTLAPVQYSTSAPFKPEYTTLLQSEYTSTNLQSDFEYTTTEQVPVKTTDKTPGKPGYGYFVSVQGKPQADALTINNLPYTKPHYSVEYTAFGHQKEEPKFTNTYATSAPTGFPSLTESFSVSIPAKAPQVAANYTATEQQATVLQQSHFSYLPEYNVNKPTVIVTSPPPKTEGFSSVSQINLSTSNSNSPSSLNKYTHSITSKPEYSFGTLGSGYVFNKTVTPSHVVSSVQVSGTPVKTAQQWTQNGQYVQNGNWKGSSYVKPVHSYYSSNPIRHTGFNVNSGQYNSQPHYSSGQYQSQYSSGQYNSGLYKKA